MSIFLRVELSPDLLREVQTVMSCLAEWPYLAGAELIRGP